MKIVACIPARLKSARVVSYFIGANGTLTKVHRRSTLRVPRFSNNYIGFHAFRVFVRKPIFK